MFCRNCGKVIGENDKFCANCGNQLSQDFTNPIINSVETHVISDCDAGKFFLFGEKLEFSEKQLVLFEFLKTCQEMKKKYVNKFEEKYTTTFLSENTGTDVFAKKQEKFSTNLKITNELFEEIYETFNKFWKSFNCYTDVKEILNSYRVDSYYRRSNNMKGRHSESEYVGVTEMYLSTTIGKINMYSDDINEIIKNAKAEIKEQRSNQSHSGSWVGGGFGIKGAIKGALTAAALNTIEGTISNIGSYLSSNKLDETTNNEIFYLKSQIDRLQTDEQGFISDINIIIDALFMATVLVSKCGFSYQAHLKSLNLARQNTEHCFDNLKTAIISYPFAVSSYDIISKYCPTETENAIILKNHFANHVTYSMSMDLKDLDATRAKNKDIAGLSLRAYTYEENGHYKEAIQYYNRILELDPNNDSAKDSLARLNVPGYTRKKTITNVDLYQTFIKDYNQIADEDFVREGLENAQKLNDFCYRDKWGYIRLKGGSRLNDKIAETIIGKKVRDLVQAEEVLYVPTLNEKKKGHTTFKEYVFINGRTVAYRRNCCFGIDYWDDIFYTPTQYVIKGDALDNIMAQCKHLKK